MGRSRPYALISYRLLCGLGALAIEAIAAPHLHADPAIVRGADGMQGTLTDLGGGTALYRTPHGGLAPVDVGPDGHQVIPEGGRQDPVRPAIRTPFGTPLPPSNLTPAPVLPFAPHGTIIPQPSSPPQIPAPGAGPRSGSTRGR